MLLNPVCQVAHAMVQCLRDCSDAPGYTDMKGWVVSPGQAVPPWPGSSAGHSERKADLRVIADVVVKSGSF